MNANRTYIPLELAFRAVSKRRTRKSRFGNADLDDCMETLVQRLVAMERRPRIPAVGQLPKSALQIRSPLSGHCRGEFNGRRCRLSGSEIESFIVGGISNLHARTGSQ